MQLQAAGDKANSAQGKQSIDRLIGVTFLNSKTPSDRYMARAMAKQLSWLPEKSAKLAAAAAR